MVVYTKDGEVIGVAEGISLTPDKNATEMANNYIRDVEMAMEIRMDSSVKRLLYTIALSPLASNNWRKHHHLPMWRSK